MKIETRCSVGLITKRILKMLETQPLVIFQPDDSQDEQQARLELLEESGFSCLKTIEFNENNLYIINTDFPNLEYKKD